MGVCYPLAWVSFLLVSGRSPYWEVCRRYITLPNKVALDRSMGKVSHLLAVQWITNGLCALDAAVFLSNFSSAASASDG